MSYTLTFSHLIGEFTTDKETLGAQDPYVIFEAGGRKCQTKASISLFTSAERCNRQNHICKYALPSSAYVVQ